MSPEHTAGSALLPIFALATVIAFGCAIVALLGRIIGPEEH
jgi:hypothetical protein